MTLLRSNTIFNVGKNSIIRILSYFIYWRWNNVTTITKD